MKIQTAVATTRATRVSAPGTVTAYSGGGSRGGSGSRRIFNPVGPASQGRLIFPPPACYPARQDASHDESDGDSAANPAAPGAVRARRRPPPDVRGLRPHR